MPDNKNKNDKNTKDTKNKNLKNSKDKNLSQKKASVNKNKTDKSKESKENNENKSPKFDGNANQDDDDEIATEDSFEIFPHHSEEISNTDQNAKEEIIQEFIAPMVEEESVDDLDEGVDHRPPMKKYKKRQMMHKKRFSIGNMDEYLHYRYRKTNKNLRLIIEMLIVVFLFMCTPTILLIWKAPPNTSLSQILNLKNNDKIIDFFRETLFFSLTYAIFIISTIMMDYNLYMIASTFSSFDVKIDGFVADFLEVLKLYSFYLRNFMAASLIFLLANALIEPYRFKTNSITPTHLLMTFIFWFACLSAVLFIEKCIVNFLTSEMKKSSFRNRIWSANFKTFVFKKMAAIAEATPKGSYEMEQAMSSVQNEFDPGYFLRHNDLDLTTEEKASEVAESIFAYLDVDSLDFQKIKEFFPDNPEDVIDYLGHSSKKPEDIIIDFEKLKTRAIELSRERKAISNSLLDRDSIIKKLDNILLFCVAFIAIIGLFLLLNVNYKFYLASVGPFLFTFSWIFQDNIKDLYKCFVFHLISHPYDVGDRVGIDEEELVVQKIDLLYTTFLDVDNKVSYVPNTSLFLKKIENIRRTKNQCEPVVVFANSETTFKKLDELQKSISKICSEKESTFTGNAVVRNTMDDGGMLKLIISVEHRGNFQDIIEKQKRRQICSDVVLKALKETGVGFKGKIQFL